MGSIKAVDCNANNCQSASANIPSKPPVLSNAIDVIRQQPAQSASAHDIQVIDDKDPNFLSLEIDFADEVYSFKIRKNRYVASSDAPETKEEFIEDIDQLPLETPKIFDYPYVTFQLSEELLRGLDGQRGEDHEIDPVTFELCVNNLAKKAKIRKITHEENALGLEFNFNDINRSILRFVLDHFKQSPSETKRFVIKTAYYPSDSNLKKNISEAQFQTWVKGLTIIDSSQDSISPPAATKP